MEVEKYNFAKAQEEAGKLKQKVVSGEASDYEDAENMFEKEIEGIKKEIISKLKRGDVYFALATKEKLKLPEEFFNDPEIQSAIKERIIYLLKEGYVDIVFEIKEKLNLPEDFFNDPEIRSAAKEGVIYLLKEGYVGSVINLLKKDNINSAFEIKEKLNLPEDIFNSAAKEGLIYLLKEGDIDSAFEIKGKLNLPEDFFNDPEIRSAAKEGVIYLLKEGHIDSAFEIKEKLNLPEELDFSEEEKEIVRAVLVYSFAGQELNKNKEDAFLANLVNEQDFSEERLKKLFLVAKKELKDWHDEQTVANPFQSGAETFGYKRMLEYIKRDNLNPHDAVHAFSDVLELYRASGLSESGFYGQILQQVQMDDREYSEGTAHQHLNAIAQTANKNIAEVIAKVQEYKEIERLQELAATFNTPQAVFASWANLKRYSELEQLLGQSEIFDELKELKAEGREKLYKYIEMLAFHPDSKVDMSAVMQFWRDPESFLAAEASHTPDEVHDRKKPSNYLNMPNLDLTASELRDALVEGKMDGLSTFTPLEVRYAVPLEDMKSEPLPNLLKRALGSKKEGLKGMAKNSQKLFNELGKLLKPHGTSAIEFIQNKSLPSGVNLSQEIEKLLYNRDFGMERPRVITKEFVARISQKSDPEAAIAGDDTVNCMPFGDGKNTVYTFNPNTAQFVIRIVKGDGKERTIAQSVLTKDMDIKKLVPDVISKLQQEGAHLDDILPADILTTAPVYVACDNVEVAPNYSNERHQQIIEAIFRDFFREYMNRYAKKEGLNPNKVPIGQGYTDALLQLPTETNTFAPQAPVSYSDKTGEDVYMLDLESNEKLDLILQKQVQESRVEKHKEAILPRMKGLEYLTFEDTLKVAYLEGKAYSDNQSLMQFLFNMENGLIAKDINNATKDRPNMSLKYTDEAGRMRGYMLVWEGKLTDENVEYNAGEFFGQPCVYISDIATDRENRMAGGRLIQGFTELYKRNYLEKGNSMPIFAQAREATSYQIVKRQLDKLGKDAGVDFELIELSTYEVGEDIMHPIIIRPVSIRP